MNLRRFNSLSPHQQALVAIALLLDDLEAASYLENDAINGQGMSKIIKKFASFDKDLRASLAATLLRQSIAKEVG